MIQSLFLYYVSTWVTMIFQGQLNYLGTNYSDICCDIELLPYGHFDVLVYTQYLFNPHNEYPRDSLILKGKYYYYKYVFIDQTFT